MHAQAKSRHLMSFVVTGRLSSCHSTYLVETLLATLFTSSSHSPAGDILTPRNSSIKIFGSMVQHVFFIHTKYTARSSHDPISKSYKVIHPIPIRRPLSTDGRGPSPGAVRLRVGSVHLCLSSNDKCARLPVVCGRPAPYLGHRASSPPFSAVARFAAESLGGKLLVAALNSVPQHDSPLPPGPGAADQSLDPSACEGSGALLPLRPWPVNCLHFPCSAPLRSPLAMRESHGRGHIWLSRAPVP